MMVNPKHEECGVRGLTCWYCQEANDDNPMCMHPLSTVMKIPDAQVEWVVFYMAHSYQRDRFITAQNNWHKSRPMRFQIFTYLCLSSERDHYQYLGRRDGERNILLRHRPN